VTKSFNSFVALRTSSLALSTFSGNFGKLAGPSASKLGNGPPWVLRYWSTIAVSRVIVWDNDMRSDVSAMGTTGALTYFSLMPPLTTELLMLLEFPILGFQGPVFLVNGVNGQTLRSEKYSVGVKFLKLIHKGAKRQLRNDFPAHR
jgi:hypothetical protein